MYATVTHTKSKGSSLPMALRAAATERVVSFTNTALRRGGVSFGRNIEARRPAVSKCKPRKCAFAQPPKGGLCSRGRSAVQWAQGFSFTSGAGYIESFDAGNMSSDPKVGQSQNRERHQSGVSALAQLFNLWWCLKALKPRWRALPRANYLTVLANPSLNRTLHSVPSISPPFHSGPIAVPLFRAG